MDLCFDKTIYILGVISAFIQEKNCNMYCFWEKALQKPTFWMNFKEIFFPYYIVWLWMLFLVILYLFEHFKVKYAQKSNKSLISTFRKKKIIFFKIVGLRSKVVTLFRWDFSYFCTF
jgi:hypothetical protein